MRLTLDTAILVRTITAGVGPAHGLLDAIASSGATLVLSRYILDELLRVLNYPRLLKHYRLDQASIAAHLQHLEALSELVEPADGPPIVLRDPKDDPIVYTALAGEADVLCTGDRHFYDPSVLAFCSRHGIQVMTDVELLHHLRSLST